MVFLVCLRSGRGSGCAVRPCGGLVIWILSASLPLMVVALGLVSVSPDPFRAGGCLVGCIGIAGYIGGCPVWLPRCCLWWFLRSVRVVPRLSSAVCCMMVGAVSWGRVVLVSVVLLPLVWVGGVLSGLHPLPFFCRCLVWVCLLWARLVWVCGRCGRCGVVTYCTSCKDHTFAPVFKL